MAALGRGLRYFVVDWGETAGREPALVGGMLARLVDDAGRGLLPALPRHTFALDEAARAFRFMAQARHDGKIVVRHGAAAPAADAARRQLPRHRRPVGSRTRCWRAGWPEQGAGRIVLVGRRGVTPEVVPLLDELRGQGCDVVAEAVDVTDAPALSALLARLRAQRTAVARRHPQRRRAGRRRRAAAGRAALRAGLRAPRCSAARCSTS